MRKTLTEKTSHARNGLRFVAAVALTGSLAAFGCSTNRTPGYGEPDMSAPAAGSIAPNPTSTPGSANTMGAMPGGTAPQAMISSSPANGESKSVDALADIRADQAYRGRVLGPAAPGDNSVPSASMQQVTGQFISPSIYANPQSTVNSSISSEATPAIVSGAAGDSGGGFVSGVALPATTAGATLGATSGTMATTANATLNGVQNVGVTGVSNTTATPITNVAGSASNVTATPVLTSVGPAGQLTAAATATNGSVLGVTNVTAAQTSASQTVTGTATANVTIPANGMTSASASPSVTAPVTLNARSTNATSTTAARARAVLRTGATSGTTSAVRITQNANGSIVVTNLRAGATNQ